MRVFSKRMAIAGASLATFAYACGDSGTKAASDSATLGDTGQTETDAQAPADPFGVSARVAKAPDGASEACARAAALVDVLQTRAAILDGRRAGFASDAAEAVTAWSAGFGAYDPLMFGEVQRVYEAIGADDEIGDGEFELLVQALSMHASFAGVDPEARARLVEGVAGLEAKFGPGPAGKAARKAAADFAWGVAELMAALQTCAPSQPL